MIPYATAQRMLRAAFRYCTGRVRVAIRAFGIAGWPAPDNDRNASAGNSRDTYLSQVADTCNEPPVNLRADFRNHLFLRRQRDYARFKSQDRFQLAAVRINQGTSFANASGA